MLRNVWRIGLASIGLAFTLGSAAHAEGPTFTCGSGRRNDGRTGPAATV
jgi:hypothetical protein